MYYKIVKELSASEGKESTMTFSEAVYDIIQLYKQGGLKLE